MPLAKIYVNEAQYDEARLTKISEAVQVALRGTLGVPPDDFFQLIFEMPRNRYLHTASFVGMQYTDDLVTLEILLVSGRSRETRLALLKDLDTRIAAAAGISPDDVFINLVEAPAKTSPSAKERRSAPTRLNKSRPQSTIGVRPHPRLIELSGNRLSLHPPFAPPYAGSDDLILGVLMQESNSAATKKNAPAQM